MAEDSAALRALVFTEDNRKAGLFDPDWYLQAYPDVKAEGLDPLQHYLLHGHAEGRNPGPSFDTRFYIESSPDVVASGINPLVHYLRWGQGEGRAPNGRVAPSRRGKAVRHVIVKEMAFEPGHEAAVLVTHAPAGRLKPHVQPYMEALRANGLTVLLVAVVDRPLELRPAEIATASGIIVRDNAGYDFGAWAHALQIEPALLGASRLILTNDSVVCSSDPARFRTLIERLRASGADVTGLTASHEHGWHLSSYFLALAPRALGSWAFQHFFRDIRNLSDKDEVIRTYEVPFAARMQAAGLSVAALYTGSGPGNPTLFCWRELIAQGFPFVKLLLLRDSFATGSDWPEPVRRALRDLRENWPGILRAAGFDVRLVQAAIDAADCSHIPAGPSTDLLVAGSGSTAISRDHTLKVAFLGPWNYDNGLGSASRELLCALRHTGVRLNVHPVARPFHVHRQICPPVATTDFAGQPDIAVVHLNPDSWHLLTADQREIVRSARQRIGYWVWETDTIPPAWQHDLHSVDRIWAPSQYCADIFSAHVDLPVDVIPHPVPVPAGIAAGRETMLRRVGVDPDRRVILYIFDGASYLIRKNPEALVRAFAAAGLARRGWSLLLKTKHLYDRPAAGEALARLVAATPGAVLADISLDADEVTSLIAAADVYASPHCSEGFGLTVAEAMAVGRPVVATDFGGTRDFLSADCGYPVSATRAVLEEDHGHYLKGHAWARIDEGALAAALTRAADAASAGDHRMGQAARAAVAHRLSYASVARRIEDSFAAAVEDSAGHDGKAKPVARRSAAIQPPPVPDVRIDPTAGVPFGRVAFEAGVIPVRLADDLAWDATPLPPGPANDWLVLAPRSSRIRADADRVILQAAAQRPDVALFYADDAAVEAPAQHRVRLKPDFNATLLVSQDYIGAPVIIRRDLFDALGGLARERRGAALYDLVLRVAEAGRTIARIPEVLLVHPGERPLPPVEQRRAALVARRHLAGVDLVEAGAPGQLRQQRQFGEGLFPRVSLLIPTNRALRPGEDGTYIERLLGAIARANWPLETITAIVGDNFADEPGWARQRWPFRLIRVHTPEHAGAQFNYAAKANQLWRLAPDDHVIFLNDDAEPSDAEWLKALVGFLAERSVGAVGARLLYANGSIQHAGMIPALRTAVHAWLGWPADAGTYFGWAEAQREWSMLTGAVLATRRSILERVNGFDERFSLEFNDVDLCLRIRGLGYRLVYNPDACFTHAEKASRGETAPPGAEVALFLSRWSEWLAHDPAYHPMFDPHRFDPVPAVPADAWFVKR
ncbi:glycosyltransferase [Novosphingobium flavum]|uniref:Glycosyltransferase n=1 Tax=Novosphingobium aerophilum TaxID=2839843 RepID=A0A7X1F7L2_9SPHN|nr:glycosyltransferase [Novosphingobium aerophilum]MBC2651897.1 glycosyltransferase [Novosphingobium aerophilum]MBC2661704.1 glycosyltransferase [Novosphingobium aerophilum]